MIFPSYQHEGAPCRAFSVSPQDSVNRVNFRQLQSAPKTFFASLSKWACLAAHPVRQPRCLPMALLLPRP